MWSTSFASWLAWLRFFFLWRSPSDNDLHSYIDKALETGEHGRPRVIPFSMRLLNDAIEKYAEKIGILTCRALETRCSTSA